MTKCEKEILGPIMVDIEQLQTAQQSELGVDHDQGITANGDHIRQVLSARIFPPA